MVKGASGAGGPRVRFVDSAVEAAHRAVAWRAAAVFIGIGRRSLRNLDVIPVNQTPHEGLPVIVVIPWREVGAVLKDALRRART